MQADTEKRKTQKQNDDIGKYQYWFYHLHFRRGRLARKEKVPGKYQLNGKTRKRKSSRQKKGEDKEVWKDAKVPRLGM